MTYRMMGGCLAAAWDGPHRAAYASPAVGGSWHVQAFAWGRCRNPTAPAGAVQSVSRRSPPVGGDWGRRASGFRRRPLTTTKRRTTHMNLGGFIDTFKEAIAKRVVESYPPLYRPSENGGTLPRLLRKPLGRRRTPSRERPSPSKPTGAPRSSARWAPARPSVRRVTRHRIPGSAGKNSEKVLGPTDPPRSESLGEKQHVGKAATVPKRCRTGSARPARYGESLIA